MAGFRKNFIKIEIRSLSTIDYFTVIHIVSHTGLKNVDAVKKWMLL